jgi:hypothetical protein
MGSSQSHTSNSAEMIVPSVFSIIGTLSVVITYLIFKRLRDLRYVEIVFYVALSDLCASTGVVLGSTANSTTACNYQAFTSNYFFLTSVMWSTVIAYQLYMIVCHEGYVPDLKYFHVFIWLFPLVVTLLPLSTNKYGTDDDISWCFVANKSDSPSYGILLWTLLSFYVWLWIAIFLIIFFFITIRVKLSQYESVPVPVMTAMYKLQMYPAILILCWIIPTCNDIDAAARGHAHNNDVVDQVSAVMPALQGVLLSIVFFSRNKLVVDEWSDVFTGRDTIHNKLLGNMNSTDGHSSNSSRIKHANSGRSSNMTLSDGSQLASSRGSDGSIQHSASSEMITYEGDVKDANANNNRNSQTQTHKNSLTVNDLHKHNSNPKKSNVKHARIVEDGEEFA